MKITKEIIPLIEKAIGFNLFPWQIDYLLNDTYSLPNICPCMIAEFNTEAIRKSCDARFDGKRCQYINRHIGKTTAHCINLALSDGCDREIFKIYIKANDPINTTKMERYSDFGDGSIRYARGFYRNEFLNIWHKLKSVGLPVRELMV